MATFFIILFIVLYLGHLLVDICLSSLNIQYLSKHSDKPPAPFTQYISAERYQKSISYTSIRQKLSLISTTITSPLFLLFIYLGILNWLDNQFNLLIQDEIHRGVLLFLTLNICQLIVEMPFSLYSTFVIEERFGFNRQTLPLWLLDLLKSLLISAVLSLLLSYTILYLMKYTQYWWLYAWLAIFGFGLTMAKLYPVIIAPLFNKFSPLEQGELRNTLEKLTQKANFPLENIYVMDASTRTTHPNAYFAGFGKSKRLVLFDSLVNEFSPGEIAAVVAHEIGHDRKKHIWKSMVLLQITSLLFFYCLYLVVDNPYLYQTFLVTSPSIYMGLLLLMFVSSVFLAYFSPLFNLLSWKFEREADRYSYDMLEDKEAIKTMLIKLSEKSLDNLTPHPLYARFYYSHPPVMQRLQYLQLEGV